MLQPPISRNRRLLMGRLRKRKMRQREELYRVEGIRGAGTVLESGARVRFAVCSTTIKSTPPGAALLSQLAAQKVDISWVEDTDLSALADTEAPQGVILVAEEPKGDTTSLIAKGARLLLLDAVQDPGNVGTLVRTAAAFGLDGVIALDGTADPFGAKAVRASAGAIAGIATGRASWSWLGPIIEESGMPLLVGSGDGENIAQLERPAGWALVVANEGAGARPEILGVAWRRVAIPMAGGQDSVNVGVAGAILMYVLTV